MKTISFEKTELGAIKISVECDTYDELRNLLQVNDLRRLIMNWFSLEQLEKIERKEREFCRIGRSEIG